MLLFPKRLNVLALDIITYYNEAEVQRSKPWATPTFGNILKDGFDSARLLKEILTARYPCNIEIPTLALLSYNTRRETADDAVAVRARGEREHGGAVVWRARSGHTAGRACTARPYSAHARGLFYNHDFRFYYGGGAYVRLRRTLGGGGGGGRASETDRHSSIYPSFAHRSLCARPGPRTLAPADDTTRTARRRRSNQL